MHATVTRASAQDYCLYLNQIFIDEMVLLLFTGFV